MHTRTDFGTDGGWREIRGMRTMRWAGKEHYPRGTGLAEGVRTQPHPHVAEDWETVAEWYFDAQGNEEKDRHQVYYLTSTVVAGVHLGLVGVIKYPRDFSEGGFNTTRRHERDVRDVYLATSRDGAHWDLSNVYEGNVLIERGGEGEWDNDQVVAACGIVTARGRHWLMYQGMDERHDAAVANKRKALGMATLPFNRWAALEPGAAATQGWVITVPFIVPANVQGKRARVHINAQIPSHGQVGVQIIASNQDAKQTLGEWKSMLDGAMDGVHLECLWSIQDTQVFFSKLAGTELQLKFTLVGKGTKLFALDLRAS